MPGGWRATGMTCVMSGGHRSTEAPDRVAVIECSEPGTSDECTTAAIGWGNVMRRSIRWLALAGSAVLWLGCGSSGATPPTTAYYDAEVVERLAPGCLEAGYDVVVCGCTLRKLADHMGSPGYVFLEMSGLEGRAWPGEASGALASWHASCETFAVALGLQAPNVAAGPPR